MNAQDKLDIINKKIAGMQETIKCLNDQLSGESDMTLLDEDIPYIQPYIADLERQISALEGLRQVLST